MLRVRRLALCVVVTVTIVRPCGAEQRGTFAGDIRPIEAVHLVEHRVRGLATTNVIASETDGKPAYVVEGQLGADVYKAIVDARVARVLSIERNGGSFYKWPGIVVVGHRGTVKFAPENTLAAFRKAIELGADLLEVDVRETRDGHLVLMHDSTVNRTTNGTGRVAAMTLAEIKRLDAGSWFSPEFDGERVPTLREALVAIRGLAVPDIDFKAGDPRKLVELLRQECPVEHITLYCGNWDLLRETLKIDRGFLARPTVPDGRVGLPHLVQEFDPPIVNMDWPQFSETLVRDVHLAGKQAFVNTMGPNDTEFGIISAVEAGADYLQSDHLDVVMAVLRSRRLHD
jgi:glycerophosphoryl diester phosphodiesterase